MRKIIFCSFLWLSSVTAHSQFWDPLIIANTDYLELSKNQKKAGWIFIEAGAVVIITAVLLSIAFGTDGSTSGSLFLCSLVPIRKGLHLLVLSSKNRRKGINLLHRKETVLQLQNNRLGYAPIPTLSLKIILWKSCIIFCWYPA